MSKTLKVLFKKKRKILADCFRYFRYLSCIPLYYLFRLLPLQNKVVASSFRGKKYLDNPKYIIEGLYKMNLDLDIVWIKNKEYNYNYPSFIRTIHFYSYWRKTYELATAKVWIDANRIEGNIRKRKGQLFIETWHGGLGIKKIQLDVASGPLKPWEIKEIKNTSKLADLFISNSGFLTQVYRSAFNYKGKVWNCGYPKSDILLKANQSINLKKIRDFYNLEENIKIFLYAPTFRKSLKTTGFDFTPYDINFHKLHKELESTWKGKWVILVRWHPSMIRETEHIKHIYGDNILNASHYPDTQELILGCDAFLSDYSSALFDAALCGKPCFIFAVDFDDYKKEQGVYYNLDELPFSYAENNEQLLENINHFNNDSYQNSWDEFKKKTRLNETGHATEDIINVIDDFMHGKTDVLKMIEDDC